MELAKWSKQRIDARNTWTRSDFCEAEWDNDYRDISIVAYREVYITSYRDVNVR
jgi:hypothetical protein